jgi:DNA-binding LacI/PurR family transcriptional regulator
MAAAGLAPDPAITVSTEFTIEGGYRAARQLLEDSAARFTAIFCASDEMAIGAIFAARDLGVRVPQDVSIIGIDGHELGEFLGLTTVDQDPERQGELAARRLLDQLEGRSDATTDEVLPIRLHVLSSTAAPSTAGE